MQSFVPFVSFVVSFAFLRDSVSPWLKEVSSRPAPALLCRNRQLAAGFHLPIAADRPRKCPSRQLGELAHQDARTTHSRYAPRSQRHIPNSTCLRERRSRDSSFVRNWQSPPSRTD